MKRLFLLGLMVLGEPALAQKVGLFCLFDQRCQPNDRCKPDELRLRIDYDTLGGDATLTTDIGPSQADVHPGPGVISFIEKLRDGLVRVTSIQAAGGEAVQTTHRVIRGTLYPTQLLGQCGPRR